MCVFFHQLRAYFLVWLLLSFVEDFLSEANRTLKVGGRLIIAEVSSRINGTQSSANGGGDGGGNSKGTIFRIMVMD